MNDTSISMRSEDTISFFSSVYICGSCTAPANSELCAIDVSGRATSAAVLPTARRGSLSRKSAKSCSDPDNRLILSPFPDYAASFAFRLRTPDNHRGNEAQVELCGGFEGNTASLDKSAFIVRCCLKYSGAAAYSRQSILNSRAYICPPFERQAAFPTGSVTRIVVPVSALCSTRTVPPCSRTISCTSARPSPTPPIARLRDLSTRKNG